MISTRALLLLSIVCALVPPVSLITAPIPSPGAKEALFLSLFGALVPALWLGLTIAHYRRIRTRNARWLFALAPLALIYPLGGLILAIGVLVKPGRW